MKLAQRLARAEQRYMRRATLFEGRKKRNHNATLNAELQIVDFRCRKRYTISSENHVETILRTVSEIYKCNAIITLSCQSLSTSLSIVKCQIREDPKFNFSSLTQKFMLTSLKVSTYFLLRLVRCQMRTV